MPEWIQDVTPFFAVLGFGLGLWNLLERWWLRRPRLKVFAKCGKQLQHPTWHSEGCALEARNTGHVDVTLASFHFEIVPESEEEGCEEEHETLTMLRHNAGPKFPHPLSPGKSCTVHVAGRHIAEGLVEKGCRGLVELRGCYKDQLGGKSKSKVFQFGIDHWAKTPERANYPETPFS